MRRLVIRCFLGLIGAFALLAMHAVVAAPAPAWAATLHRDCGFGTSATMLANKEPALAYPVTPQDPRIPPSASSRSTII